MMATCCMTVRTSIISTLAYPADTAPLQHSWGCFNCMCTLAATRSSLSKLGHAFIPQCHNLLSSRCLAVISYIPTLAHVTYRWCAKIQAEP